jgi:hypothetical protein
MAFRSSANNGTASSTLVLNKPTGTVAGDVILLFAVNTGTLGFSWPSGFTELPTLDITTTNYTMQAGGAWKIATGAEGSSFTVISINSSIGAAISFSGRSSVGVEANSTNTASTTQASPFTIAANEVTASESADLLWVGFFRFDAIGEPADGVTTPPTGYTLTDNVTVLSGRGVSLAYKEAAASGATGTVSTTGAAGTFDDRSAVRGAYLISLPLYIAPPTIYKQYSNGAFQAIRFVEGVI